VNPEDGEPLLGDHVNIVKCRSRDDENYLALLGSIKEMVAALTSPLSKTPSTKPKPEEKLTIPLLIFVGSRGFATRSVDFAQGLHIKYRETESPADLQSLIADNMDFFRRNNSPAKIRVLADSVLRSTGQYTGEETIHSFRSTDLDKIPVYIYATPMPGPPRSPDAQTDYVKRKPFTGSTREEEHVLKYILGLKDGLDDLEEWGMVYYTRYQNKIVRVVQSVRPALRIPSKEANATVEESPQETPDAVPGGKKDGSLGRRLTSTFRKHLNEVKGTKVSDEGPKIDTAIGCTPDLGATGDATAKKKQAPIPSVEALAEQKPARLTVPTEI